MSIREALPFLIPVVLAELALFIVTLRHILTHRRYKRGSRTLWVVVSIVGINFIGPVLYFLLGREEA
ncbi:PLDc N-terminal domain-containing protein [Saccharibacillus sp. CPCC 101409]|uniref:PLDc N-terminal domain-containing protein n=1 Tax=Saccharibacillus sp. CPCC 101409 TaxID=3058041 RepID=UPI0026727D10|nr:PLDc N-terminal domain-containing protein [Saccharibacillus sp. CPCC 101409]MDO3410340.1 PLDc N-terminal domain-containing protein [Saccharibacillus sp. CPCC 101409]